MNKKNFVLHIFAASVALLSRRTRHFSRNLVAFFPTFFFLNETRYFPLPPDEIHHSHSGAKFPDWISHDIQVLVVGYAFIYIIHYTCPLSLKSFSSSTSLSSSLCLKPSLAHSTTAVTICHSCLSHYRQLFW